MINYERWNKNIYKALNNLADKNFQKKAWFDNTYKYTSSPDEAYYTLIEDNVFDEYIANKEIGLNDHQKEEAQKFIQDFNDYCNLFPGYLDPRIVINDPKWDIIRQKAKRLIDTLDLGKYKNTND